MNCLRKGAVLIDVICGARPNFMKIDSLVRAASFPYRIVHTGQHYDHAMSGSFFEQLGLPLPDVSLGCGGGSISSQTARIMEAYEPVMLANLPEAVVVVGDVNSTLACSLVAVRHGVPVVHLEAGLRSFDRTMPEEINRLLTDQIASLLLITSPEARDNLLSEGRPDGSVIMTGNTMIDTLLRLLPRSDDIPVPSGDFALVTLHRPGNVDDRSKLTRILAALGELELPLVFPAHPRTMKHIVEWGLSDALPSNLTMVPPMEYLAFIAHQRRSAVVITDSGGVQEETSVMGVPCVTVRPNTERPITCEIGTNVLCPEPGGIPAAVAERLSSRGSAHRNIPFWDGAAGRRSADAIERFLQGGES